MVLELRQNLKLAQQLVMTPQLQQAIKLLQLARLELAATIQQEIEQNPVLEEEIGVGLESDGGADPEALPEVAVPERTSEINVENNSSLAEIDWKDYENEYESASFSKQADSNDLPSRMDILTKKPDLHSHLEWQLKFSDLTDAEKEAGMFVIGNLNRDGFLDIDEEDLIRETGCCSPEAARKVISKIQEMDPPGVGARNVQESLLLQLERLGLADSLASIMVSNHLKLLETKNYAAIAKATGRSVAEVVAAVKVIVNLDPFPGRIYSDEEPQYIIPDVYVHKVGDEFVIMLNDDGLPRLRVSSYYREILKKGCNTPDDTREYIQGKIRSATWLIKSIQQRQRTIYRTVESLLKFQREFFEKGVGYLKPLILRDVADDISMHESTISRVTSNKYVHTPQGIFELKYFFNTSIDSVEGDSVASTSVKARIRQVIQAENPDKPLSDQAISDMFRKEENIVVARRTVAKYREQLGILPSKYRKKPKLGR